MKNVFLALGVATLLSTLTGCCCCGLSPDTFSEIAEEVDASDEGGNDANTVEKFGITAVAPKDAIVQDLKSVYVGVLLITHKVSADNVTFSVYPSDQLITPESVDAHLEGYKEEQLETWPDSKFTSVEMKIFGKTAKGIERAPVGGLPGAREFALDYPQQKKFISVSIEIWPPRNQEFVDTILASAKFDPTVELDDLSEE